MGYVAHEAAELLDRTSEEIARLGQITGAEVPADGKGYRAFYSFANLVEMRITEELTQFGVPRKHIQRYLTALRNSHMRWLEEDGAELGAWLVIGGEKWAAGSTMTIALGTLQLSGPIVSFVAIDAGAIKQAILRRNGDAVDIGQ